MGQFIKGIRILKENGIKELLGRSIDKGLKSSYLIPLTTYITKSRLKRKMKEEKNLNDILDTTFSFSWTFINRSIEPMQVREELRKLAKLVKKTTLQLFWKLEPLEEVLFMFGPGI